MILQATKNDKFVISILVRLLESKRLHSFIILHIPRTLNAWCTLKTWNMNLAGCQLSKCGVTIVDVLSIFIQICCGQLSTVETHYSTVLGMRIFC